ncbi:MAG: acyl carrier protein [Mycoplasmataceae bacterium]|nr:acyl carrier protein [Mycoplasmataceae bacterium]MBQ5500690.1 acyl carrier protein [Mycoplasmataceae bacterium]MBQ5543528.1 acyl carrier protein [Mycoplasmataceae bacterium]
MNKLSEEQIKKINAVLKEQKINVDLTNEADLQKNLTDLGIDSLNALSIIVNLEEKFNIHMDDQEIAKIKNLQELINLLSKTINN